MSLALLTALLITGQTAKSAELPIDPNVTCSAEESEPAACEQTDSLPCRKVEAQVAELLEACQRAIADGKRKEARSLIYQAMLLDPDGIAVKVLAERLQESGEEGKEEASENSAPVDPITAPEEALQPPLPPIDPGIVIALENVLRESGEPTEPKLIVGTEEPAENEPEEPVSQWPGAPPVEIPSLWEDPEAENGADPEIGEENPAEDSDELPRAELEQLLREACEAVKQGNYVKLDKQPFARSIPMQIGGVQCVVIADDWGHRYLIVKLTPEASGDLRLMQEAHDERVLDWILAHNNGGNLPESAEEPTGYGREELQELREDIENPEPEEEAIN